MHKREGDVMKTIKQIIDNIGVGIYVIDRETKKIILANKNIERLVGMKLVGRYCYEIQFSGDDTLQSTNLNYLNKQSTYRELCVPEKSAWYSVKNIIVDWIDKRQVSMCIVEDITEKKKYKEDEQYHCNNDILTGLYNRMKCEKDLNEAIADAMKNKEEGIVLFIDLDNFKMLNDGMGHQYGDKLLKQVSEGLKSINEIGNYCYRMGGDEFVIIIKPEYMYMSSEIIGKVYQMFRNPWKIEDTEYYGTMSMGVVYYPEDGTSVNELIKKADIAMYDAKNGGKNRIEYYNAYKDGQIEKRLDMEKNMRLAISGGCDEFKLYIQPVIDARTEKCMGGEALIRWDSSKLGFIAPNDFIPLAENLGLINDIGAYFLEFACKINKNWQDRNVNAHINVNLSIVQLMQDNIAKKIEDIIKNTHADPHNIILEVTESIVVKDVGRMQKVMERLKNIGVKIALDDFGTGYSSLSYINQMQFDIIKVDKSFVDKIETDDYSKTFIKLITDLSEKIGAKVCIEGVETKGQLDELKKMNVDMIQGYYYGKPVPYDEFERDFLGL